MAIAFPVTTNLSGLILGKAFAVCVIGGLGTVPGALAGGLALGFIEALSGHWFGAQVALMAGSVLMLVLLAVRPTGLLGMRGYE
jgi:branched-chain amino acid transport system permease protein